MKHTQTQGQETGLASLFRDIPAGQVFDFVSGTHFDSFFARCVKLSARRYGLANEPDRKDQSRTVYRVGSINCKVYHVGPQS